MAKTKYIWLKCSQCGRRFRGSTRTEALARIRKHLWSKHEAWMKRRIKAGIKKSKRNPKLAKAVLSGVFPPLMVGDIVRDYRAMSERERQTLKNLLRYLTAPVGAEASAIAEATLRTLDYQIQS